MDKRLLHTPDGVRDIYNEECEHKLQLQQKLHRVLKSYGCMDIETPTFEFFDVFSRDVGTTPSRELYKFFDKEGNTLVLRPDITPSIARAVSKYFDLGSGVTRVCYVGNTFINHSSYQGRLKENTHLGAEVIGADDAQADAEVIAMVVDCLRQAGLKEFQISIGQVEYFRSILQGIEIPEETEMELKDFISNRNLFGAEQLLADLPIDDKSREALLALPSLYGTVEVLDRAEKLACNEVAQGVVRRLRDVYRLLECYGVTRYVSFDLSMLSSYNYYTGIFFRGYTFGTGDAVVRGGRYDGLLAHFGKDAPSIGFVVVVNALLSALGRQGGALKPSPGPVAVCFGKEDEERAIRLACRLREKGLAAAMQFTPEPTEETRDAFLALCREHGIS